MSCFKPPSGDEWTLTLLKWMSQRLNEKLTFREWSFQRLERLASFSGCVFWSSYLNFWDLRLMDGMKGCVLCSLTSWDHTSYVLIDKMVLSFFIWLFSFLYVCTYNVAFYNFRKLQVLPLCWKHKTKMLLHVSRNVASPNSPSFSCCKCCLQAVRWGFVTFLLCSWDAVLRQDKITG